MEGAVGAGTRVRLGSTNVVVGFRLQYCTCTWSPPSPPSLATPTLQALIGSPSATTAAATAAAAPLSIQVPACGPGRGVESLSPCEACGGLLPVRPLHSVHAYTPLCILSAGDPRAVMVSRTHTTKACAHVRQSGCTGHQPCGCTLSVCPAAGPPVRRREFSGLPTPSMAGLRPRLRG